MGDGSNGVLGNGSTKSGFLQPTGRLGDHNGCRPHLVVHASRPTQLSLLRTALSRHCLNVVSFERMLMMISTCSRFRVNAIELAQRELTLGRAPACDLLADQAEEASCRNQFFRFRIWMAMQKSKSVLCPFLISSAVRIPTRVNFQDRRVSFVAAGVAHALAITGARLHKTVRTS